MDSGRRRGSLGVAQSSTVSQTRFDDDVFTEVFGSTVRFNEEGEIVAVGEGKPAEGVPFTEAAVCRVVETEPVASAGAACLALAWRHRDTLGL